MLRAAIFLLFNLALAAPRLFVPSINTLDATNNGFMLEPTEDQYTLIIRDNSNVRQETVVEVAPGQLQVKGRQEQDFDENGHLEITYEAGPNGNVVKYIYRTRLTPGGGSGGGGYALPVAILKSGAG